VSLSAASGKTVTVTVKTANGTAKAGSDYTALSSKVTFVPGQTSKSVTVFVHGDKVKERNETLYLQLSAPSNTTLGAAKATGTIKNDDK
jgi:hypothetical protein